VIRYVFKRFCLLKCRNPTAYRGKNMLVLIVILALIGFGFRWYEAAEYQWLPKAIENNWASETYKRNLDQFLFETRIQSACFGAAAMGLITLHGSKYLPF
jgi:hypothetical protein